MNGSLFSDESSGHWPAVLGTPGWTHRFYQPVSQRDFVLFTVRTAKITDRTFITSAINQAINHRQRASLELF